MKLSQDRLDQFNRNDLYTTIDLNIQYLAPAKESPYTCLAETIHQTRHLAFVRAEIRDARKNPIASGQATFRLIKMDLV